MVAKSQVMSGREDVVMSEQPLPPGITDLSANHSLPPGFRGWLAETWRGFVGWTAACAVVVLLILGAEIVFTQSGRDQILYAKPVRATVTGIVDIGYRGRHCHEAHHIDFVWSDHVHDDRQRSGWTLDCADFKDHVGDRVRVYAGRGDEVFLNSPRAVWEAMAAMVPVMGFAVTVREQRRARRKRG